MRIGSVTLKVTSGDITKEDTEVIVNIANQTFDATSGIALWICNSLVENLR